MKEKRHKVASERSKANWSKTHRTMAQPSPTQKPSEATAAMAQPAERSNGYSVPQPHRTMAKPSDQQDWPHEFYVKKSGSGER
jgi:hypothetical protein